MYVSGCKTVNYTFLSVPTGIYLVCATVCWCASALGSAWTRLRVKLDIGCDLGTVQRADYKMSWWKWRCVETPSDSAETSVLFNKTRSWKFYYQNKNPFFRLLFNLLIINESSPILSPRQSWACIHTNGKCPRLHDTHIRHAHVVHRTDICKHGIMGILLLVELALSAMPVSVKSYFILFIY